jgi:hypothetical protein
MPNVPPPAFFRTATLSIGGSVTATSTSPSASRSVATMAAGPVKPDARGTTSNDSRETSLASSTPFPLQSAARDRDARSTTATITHHHRPFHADSVAAPPPERQSRFALCEPAHGRGADARHREAIAEGA